MWGEGERKRKRTGIRIGVKKEYLERWTGSLRTNRYSNLKNRLAIENYDNLTISCEI